MNHILTSWKSTAVGFAVLLGVGMNAVHFDAVGHLAMTTQNWFALAGGVIAAGVAMMQQDAGVTLAQKPGQDSPEAVRSHETPNDPAATPVEAASAK